MCLSADCPRMSADFTDHFLDVRGLSAPLRLETFLTYGSCPRLSGGVGNRFNEHYSCPRLSAGCGKIKHALVRGVFPCLLVLGGNMMLRMFRFPIVFTQFKLSVRSKDLRHVSLLMGSKGMEKEHGKGNVKKRQNKHIKNYESVITRLYISYERIKVT